MASARYEGFKPLREDLMELGRFQELFVGRFNTNEAVVIMESFKYDAVAAVNFVMEATNTEVMKLMKDEQASLDLANKFEGLRLSGSLLDDATLGEIDRTVRQFACGPCDRSWWRRTPERKQVSKCFRCLVRYDPVPREQEWGWAQFECPNCTRTFSGHCSMDNTSRCYVCNTQVKPSCIQPPQRKRGRRTLKTHSCDAPDCCVSSHQEPRGSAPVAQAGARSQVQTIPLPRSGSAGGDLTNTDPGEAGDYDLSQGVSVEGAHHSHQPPPPPPVTCVEPSTRRANGHRKVIVPSRPHDSTGSTVDTFLTQSDIDRGNDTSSRMSSIDENYRP